MARGRFLFDKEDSSCKHPNVSLQIEDHENGRTTCWWECDSCKLAFNPGGEVMFSTLASSKAYTLKAIKRHLNQALRHHVGNEYAAKNQGWSDTAEHHRQMKVSCQKLLDPFDQNLPDATALAAPDYPDRTIEFFQKNVWNRPDPEDEKGQKRQQLS